METAKPENISQMNKIAIVRALKEYGCLSRADLTRILNMSFPSVSGNIKQLLENDYIHEIGEAAGKDGLGRRSVLLGFNEKRGYVVGVFFNINSVTASCADLLGTPLAVSEKNMDLKKGGEYAYLLIREAINDVIRESGIGMDKLESICVGIPGIYDESTRKNKFVPYLHAWEDVPILERLKEDFIENVIIENVVNLGAIGEKWKGNAQNNQNILYIDYELGISTGLIMNGKLYKGATGLAGEVGYMVIEHSQLTKKFSDEGALEEIISGIALSDYYEKISGKHSGHFAMSTISQLIELCKNGDAVAERAVNEVVEYLSNMIVNAVVVLNPELVVLSGGNGTLIGQNYLARIIQLVGNHVPYLPEIKLSRFTGSQAGLYGALYTALINAASNIDYERYD